MNKNDLRRYQDQLTELRDRLLGEIPRMIKTIQTDSMPTGEHDLHTSESFDKELTLERTEEQMNRDVVDALARIDAGTYGNCLGCGHAIAKERLDAIPFARFCVKCERAEEARGTVR